MKFPNSLSFYNLYRLILTLTVITINSKIALTTPTLAARSQIYPIPTLTITLIFLPFLFFFLLKNPILKSHYNELTQTYVAIIIYLMIVRVLELSQLGSFDVIIVIFGAMFVCCSVRWWINRRILSILMKEFVRKEEEDAEVKLSGIFIERIKILCYLA